MAFVVFFFVLFPPFSELLLDLVEDVALNPPKSEFSPCLSATERLDPETFPLQAAVF